MKENKDRFKSEQPEPKKLDLDEFMEKGYLQEVNRRFFHPLGLALAVDYDTEYKYTMGLSYILDSREDTEGFIFGDGDNQTRLKKKEFIDQEFEKRREVREKLFGNIIQPLDNGES